MAGTCTFVRRVGMLFCCACLLAAPAVASPDASRTEFRDGVDVILAGLELSAADTGGHRAQSAVGLAGAAGSGETRQVAPHLLADLRNALDAYRATWGDLPQQVIPSGPTLRPGQNGRRVALLRERLGLDPGDRFDDALAAKVRSYRATHGLGQSAFADSATIASLNLGAEHYEQLIRLNLERLEALPPAPARRYILVDAAAARLWLYEDGEAVDAMKVIVGKPASPTPMMATQMSWVELNPYWNVPPDLVRRQVASRVLGQGDRYLDAQGYELWSDFSAEAQRIEPDQVNWQEVAAGRLSLRVRQRPGSGNAMGSIKFLLSNRLGIYLHDTPDRDLFARSDRWQSNGCVRVEDAARLARWLFDQKPPEPSGAPGEFALLDRPVPVYITYLTVAADPDGNVRFGADPYNRDALALAQLRQLEDGVRSASLR